MIRKVGAGFHFRKFAWKVRPGAQNMPMGTETPNWPRVLDLCGFLSLLTSSGGALAGEAKLRPPESGLWLRLRPSKPTFCPSCLCLKRWPRLQTTTAWRRPPSGAGFQLSRPLMTSPDWWFEAEPVEPFYELQRGPGQILYKEAGQRTQSTWTSDSFTIRAGKWCQILVPDFGART